MRKTSRLIEFIEKLVFEAIEPHWKNNFEVTYQFVNPYFKIICSLKVNSKFKFEFKTIRLISICITIN